MKKYLSLAVILGAIAFLGVSHFAQAQSEAAGAAAEKAVAPAAEAPADAMAPAAAAVSSYAKDLADCDALVSAPTTEGETPAAAEKADALKKCLVGKGHTEEEVTKEEAAAPATADAPAADAPVEAPADAMAPAETEGK